MNKKFLLILILILILAISAGSFFGKKNPASKPNLVPTIENIDSDSEGLLDTEETGSYVADKNWLYDGPIYETHPYYYNGTFEGLTGQIPSIADLGVKTIYLMPIWEHRSKNPQYLHIYLINDYYKIDPRYGTADDLKNLVNAVHKYNMKIVFDMVTAALPKENIAYRWTLRISLADLEKKAQEQGLSLKYTKDDFGNRIVYTGGYFTYLLNSEIAGIVEGQEAALFTYPSPLYGPAIDRTNPDAIKYFTGVAEYYVKEYDIDGWRLDSTYDAWNPKIISGDHSVVNMAKSMRTAVKKIKPDAIFLAEQASNRLDEVADASYEPKEQRVAIADGLIKGKMTSQGLVDAINGENIGYSRTRIYFSETHDLKRVLENYSKQQSEGLLVLNSTIPRIPMIQSGQEVGSKNHWFSLLPSNPKVNWNGGDNQLRDFYKKVFSIRNSSDAFKYGDIKNVWRSGDNVYAYSRTYGDETVVVVINMNSKQTESILSMPFPENTKLTDELSGEIFTISDSANFKIIVPAYSSRILLDK